MRHWNWIAFAFALICGGCSGANPAPEAATANPDSRFVSAERPSDGIPVGQARQSLLEGQSATVIGVIGGSAEPFVDGLAAFTIVDPQVPYCPPEEGCPTPWDYCCTQDQVRDNIATVKLVDESNSPVPGDARTILGVRELSTVVVRGIAKRDERGNLTIAATSIFVEPGQ